MPAPKYLDSIWATITDTATTGLGKNAGMVVGVLWGGEQRIGAYGVLNECGQAPSEHTVFEIGSVTKVFTALALADMVLRGDVALDDPVRKCLPATVHMPSWRGEEITLLHLATHTSSLPRLPDNLAKTIKHQANPYANYQVSDMYEFLSSYKLGRPLGSREEYSNLGMGLLGHALELVAGKSYEELVRERILQPLGMNDTSIALSTDQLGRLAPGHTCDGKLTGNWDTPALAACGAFRSTMHDMLVFIEANMRPAASPLAPAIRLCQRRFPMSGGRTPWKGYAFAILVSGLSAFLQWQFRLVPGNLPFALSALVPTLLAAWFGGLGAGLLATAATTAATYFMQYKHDFAWWFVLLFGGVMSLLVTRRSGLRRRGTMLAWQSQRMEGFDRGPLMVWHNGGTGGYASFVCFARETESAVVVLSNSEASVDAVGEGILTTLIQET
jgi:CubicO group peptidase (beta-lactamase class C family)